MAERIEVDVPQGEAAELLRALGVRGLPATLAGAGPGDEAVAVLALERESTPVLLSELLPALELWARERALGAPTIRVGGRAYRLGSEAEAARCLRDARPLRRATVQAA